MDAKLNNLVLILERMNVLYERMLGILLRERTALIAMDFETIMVEMREKDEILSALRGLDRDRLRIQDQFAMVMGQDPESVSLRTLAEALIEQGGSARERGVILMDLRERVAGTVGRLRDRIESNSKFMEKSVESLQQIAAQFTATVSGRGHKSGRGMAVYNGKAKYQQAPGQTGTLMEKRL